MPNRVYTNVDQLATTLASATDPGYDVVPSNVLKLAFVILAANTFTAETIIQGEEWQDRLALTTGAKPIITPYIDSFEVAPTTPITEGGNDTSTANGVPRLRSTSFAPIKGMISACSAAQADAIRKLAAKSGNFQHGTRLGVYLLHEGGGISGLANGKPIPIYNVFIGDPKKGGLGASDDYNFEAHFEGGWSKNQTIYEADFEVRTLVNA